MGAARRRGAGRAGQEGRADGTANWQARRTPASPRLNPALSAVVEVFEDAIADPGSNGTNLAGPFAGLPFLMKDLGPTMKGRLQEMGSLLMRGNRATADTFLTAKMRQAGLNLIGRTTTPEFGVCSSADNPAVYVTRNPWNTDYTTCGSSAGSAAMVAAGVGADRACHRRRRFDPHSRRRQRQYRAEGFARRVLARAASVRLVRAGIDPGLPVALGARYRCLRRCLPRSRARRIDAVLDLAGALSGHDQARSATAQNRALAPMGRLSRDAADRCRTRKGRTLPRRPRPSRRLRVARDRLSRRL